MGIAFVKWSQASLELQGKCGIDPCEVCGAEPTIQTWDGEFRGSSMDHYAAPCDRWRRRNVIASRRVRTLEVYGAWLGASYGS